MIATHRNRISKVGIVDDDTEAIQIAEVEVIDAGYAPLIIKPPIQSCFDLARELSLQVDGVICDHRLGYSGFADFYGAELVATLYDIKIPAILVTQYIEIDNDVSIRKWRHKIPVLINRGETNPQRIVTGFSECIDEFQGRLRIDRKPHRTLIRVEDESHEDNEYVLDVVVPAWNPNQAVRFPKSLIPPELSRKIRPPFRLIALVNLGARKSEDLYFRNFELAPEISEDDIIA